MAEQSLQTSPARELPTATQGASEEEEHISGALHDTHLEMASYTYLPLSANEPFRILELEPAAHTGDILRGKLLHANAEDTYEAISYVWGNPTRTHCIALCSGSCELAITESADSALRGLRHATEPRRLWIDAICINQTDNEEKAVQVRKMNKVYRNAERVLVWLGNDEDDDGLGSRVVAFVRSFNVEIRGYPDVFPRVHPTTLKEKAQRHLHATTLEPLSAFLDKTWFKRRWVVQEVGCSREALIHCGNYSLDFTDFVKLVEILQSESISQFHITHDILVCLRATLRMMRSHSDMWAPSINIPASCDSHLDIAYMLNTFGNHQCLDDRDKIFALLGLMDEDAVPHVNVDYEQTATDLYRDLGSAYIVSRHFTSAILGLLQCAGAFQPIDFQQRQLPSFIPDWRNQKSFAPLLNYTFRWDYANTILRDDDPFEEPIYHQEEQKLILYGVIVGTIIDSTPAAGPDNAANALDFPLQEWIRLLNNPVFEPAVPNSDKDLLQSVTAIFWSNPFAAFWTLSQKGLEDYDSIKNVLTCGMLDKLGWAMKEQLNFWCGTALKKDRLSRFLGKFPWWRNMGINKIEREIKETASDFEDCERIFQHSIAGRSLFATETRILGLGPGNLKTGDILAVFSEATVPFVLRPTGTPQEYWVVGDAYSYELMWHWKDYNGGLMEDPEARPNLAHLAKCSFVLV